MGWSADQVVVWPTQGANRPQLLGIGLVWASFCPKDVTWLVLAGFGLVLRLDLVHLSLNLCSDFIYDFISDQSVFATCKIA